MNAEADAICQASRYQRNLDRLDTRAGSYKHNPLTQAAKVELNVPRLRTLSFATQVIQRYQTRQSSVEEALIEMHLTEVSVSGGGPSGAQKSVQARSASLVRRFPV